MIFTSLLNFLGRLGGLYINLRGQGYLQIYSPRAFWDVDSFREMLRKFSISFSKKISLKNRF